MQNNLKIIITSALAAGVAYFGRLAIPLMVLFAVVIIDYISGLFKAYRSSELCAKYGMIGIAKKVGYFLLVSIGSVTDWILYSGLSKLNLEVRTNGFIAILVTIWLILNEMISVLENLYALGVPAPPGLQKLILHLKSSTDSMLEDENGNVSITPSLPPECGQAKESSKDSEVSDTDTPDDDSRTDETGDYNQGAGGQ